MAGKELELRLLDDGNELQNPPFSIDELLSLLHKIEVSLSKVNQSPCESMLAALSPLRNALVSDKLLRHSDTDVKVSVAFCISEIIRITAPNAPYDDELMKEIFHQVVAVFQKLSHMSSCCYPKAVSVLVTVAMTRAVVVMLDLDCHALIVEMFELFLKTVRSNNSDVVLSAMVAIMTVAILESDIVLLETLVPLLASVRKENQNVSPTSWKLGKEIIKNCAVKIEPYLVKAVYSLGVSLDNYDQIVGSICQHAADSANSFGVQGSEEQVGQPMEFPSHCSSLTASMQQPTAFGKRWSNQLVNRWCSQGEPQENQDIPVSKVKFPTNFGRSNACDGKTFVHGYEMKSSNAPVLTAIFAKYGDIAANCKYKTPSIRASLLEIVCDVVLRLQSTDIPLTFSEIKMIQNEVKDLEATKLEVSWLIQPLERISEVEKIAQMHTMLKSVKANGVMVIKAATKELEGTLMELVALQKRMGEAERRINAMKLVVQKIDDAIKEAEVEELLWQRQMNELL